MFTTDFFDNIISALEAIHAFSTNNGTVIITNKEPLQLQIIKLKKFRDSYEKMIIEYQKNLSEVVKKIESIE